MGGQPIIALNIVCFPDCLNPDILSEIMKGGADKVKEAGAVLVGGHSVSDDEPKYGLSVTGMVHPDEIYANAGAKPGDVLILTKPLGLGIINTAIKAGLASKEQIDVVIDVMTSLNNVAAEGMKTVKTHACTDITGFGLAGHVLEMAKGSDVTMEIIADQVKVIEGTVDHAEMGMVPAGAYRNKNYMEADILIEDNINAAWTDILYDPQTSGGLLLSVAEEDAESLLAYYKEHLKTDFSIVGRVTEKQSHPLIIK